MKAYAPLFRLLEKLIDLGVNLLAVYFGYVATVWYANPEATPEISIEAANAKGLIIAALVIAVLSIIAYSYAGVYRPMRSEPTTFYVGRLLTVNFSILCLYIIYAAIDLSEYTEYFFWAMAAAIAGTMATATDTMIVLGRLNSVFARVYAEY